MKEPVKKLDWASRKKAAQPVAPITTDSVLVVLNTALGLDPEATKCLLDLWVPVNPELASYLHGHPTVSVLGLLNAILVKSGQPKIDYQDELIGFRRCEE